MKMKWWQVGSLGIQHVLAMYAGAIVVPLIVGGALIAMFGMVIAYGVKMLGQVDLTVQENLLIIACSVGVGLGVTAVPNLFVELPTGLRILTDSGIVAGSMTAIILNAVFHFGKARKSAALPLQEQKIS
ncbi:xanthine permease [Geobacillus kaustophilus NBRC 102445]|nr:xanthine permease [Geobacillus kaustophilus NBRC 102445]